MKHFIFMFAFVLIVKSSIGQVYLDLPKNNELTVKENKTNTTYSFAFKIIKLPDAGKIRVSDANSGLADLGKDYDYLPTIIEEKTYTLNSYLILSFTVNNRNIKRDKFAFTVTFGFTVGNSPETEKLTVNIDALNPATDLLTFPDTSKWTFKIITGSNFDFFEAPVFKNFAGDLNVFIPDLIQYRSKNKMRKLGVEFGFFNYRYFDSDSSNGNIQNEKYLLDPSVRTIVAGTTKYVSDIYALNSRANFNTFGVHLEPMIPVYNNKFTDVYFNLHFEWLWRTQIQTYDKAPLRKDTMVYTMQDSNQGLLLQSFPGLRPSYAKRTFNDVYLGAGFPIRINLKNALFISLTPTIGAAGFDGIKIETSVDKNLITRTYTPVYHWFPYFLAKAQFITTIAPIDIALGGEFRKVSGQPLFLALYLGGVIPIDKLKK